jgi:hypothetical protein
MMAVVVVIDDVVRRCCVKNPWLVFFPLVTVGGSSTLNS